jgi:ABC-type phosphate transport system substrate-binding protein
MRKMIIAAATAATVATLGFTATAQAQSAVPHIAATAKKQVVAGIPASIKLTNPGGTGTKCTVKVTGLPGPVTAGTASTVNKGCTVEIEGVWPTPGTKTVTVKFTAGGTTTTTILSVAVLTKPCENDAVGVGSDTITPLTDQLATDYNNTLPARTACNTKVPVKPFEDSWDAVNPISGAIGDSIPEKSGCASIARPNGSSAGIAQLATFSKDADKKFLCTNFARSSRARGASDPAFGPGGVAFVALAGDAVSWSTPSVNTAAPATLTPAQLASIYTCSVTNWNQVGGANQAIVPFLPQAGSGTLSFWLTALGNITPGPCVSNNGNMLEENEGVNPVLNNPGAIFIYSVGDYIAQKFHADKCLKTACTANASGVICKKTPDKVQYWCDVHGTMTPRKISGIAPTTGSGTGTKINPAFPATFDRTLFNVVPFDPATSDHIPGASSPVGGLPLQGIFGAGGFDCKSSTAKTDITQYGFVPLGLSCGGTN